MKRFIASSLLALALTAALGGTATAVDPGSGQALEIAPPLVNLKADPGETIKTEIKIRDIAQTQLLVTGEVNDFTSQGEEGIPKVDVDAEERSPYSIIDWVEPLNQLVLEPQEIKSLPITIRVPANASPGGYYGVIRFTATPGELEQSGVALSASLGALIFIRVNGDANESMEIEELFAEKNGRRSTFFDSKPITFVQRIKNTGNVQEQPVGILKVSDMFGNTIANLTFNAERRNVLPDSIRRFETSLDKTNIGSRILFGLYTAELTTTFGANNDMTTTETTRIFVFPWQIVLGIVVALAAVIGGFRYWLRSRDQRVYGNPSRGRGRGGRGSRGRGGRDSRSGRSSRR